MCGGGGFFGGVTDAFEDIGGGIADLGQSAISAVSDLGSQIDDTVNQIPGGWGTVAVATGIYFSPEIGAYINGATGEVVSQEAALAAANDVAAQQAAAAAMPGTDAGIAGLTYGQGEGAFPGVEPGTVASDVAGTSGGIETLYGQGEGAFPGATEGTVASDQGLFATTPDTTIYAQGEGAFPGPTEGTVASDQGLFVPTDTGMIYAQGEGAFPGVAAGTVASDVAGTGIDTGIIGGVGGIGLADILKYAGLAGLASALLGGGKTAGGGGGNGPDQTPVGAGLSPDYKPYRYMPYAGGGIVALADGGQPPSDPMADIRKMVEDSVRKEYAHMLDPNAAGNEPGTSTPLKDQYEGVVKSMTDYQMKQRIGDFINPQTLAFAPQLLAEAKQNWERMGGNASQLPGAIEGAFSNYYNQVNQLGAPKAQQDFYTGKQFALGQENQTMGNPEYAALQAKINALAPVASQQNWAKSINAIQPYGTGPSAVYRDPKTGSGMAVYQNPDNQNLVSSVRYFDPSGRNVNTSIFNAPDIYENAEKYGINLGGIGTLGSQLQARGAGYLPGQLYPTTINSETGVPETSNLGVNFGDIAQGKMGTAYDWTQDPLAAQKGPTAVDYIQRARALAKRLGITPYAEGGITALAGGGSTQTVDNQALINEAIQNIRDISGEGHSFFGAQEPLAKHLASEIERIGPQYALRNFYQEQQGLVGFGKDGWFDQQNMGNPEYAKYQQLINAQTPKASEQAFQDMVSKTTGNRELAGVYRDPTSGGGVGYTLDPRTRKPYEFTYYDPSGSMLKSSILRPEDVYENAERFGISLSGINTLANQLQNKNVPYMPGSIYPQSDYGVDIGGLAKGAGLQQMASEQDLQNQLTHYQNQMNAVAPFGAVNPAVVQANRRKEIQRRYEMAKRLAPLYHQLPEEKQMAEGGITALAGGGYNLGGYSDGGRLLRGPGDGVSDDIPATIGGKQPARLADGEFVVPARIVSEIGNGSTDAGARKLYEMMDRVQSARRKTMGKKQFAKDTKSDKYLPA